MRFTVKTKLANAFGAIIILSAVTGGVAYMNLTELAATSRTLVSRGERLDKAAQLQAAVLDEVRAQKDMILSKEDADIISHADGVKKFRDEAASLRDAINATTNEAGRALMAKFSTESDKANKVEDEDHPPREVQLCTSTAISIGRWTSGAAVKDQRDRDGAAVVKTQRAPRLETHGRLSLPIQARMSRRWTRTPRKH